MVLVVLGPLYFLSVTILATFPLGSGQGKDNHRKWTHQALLSPGLMEGFCGPSLLCSVCLSFALPLDLPLGT